MVQNRLIETHSIMIKRKKSPQALKTISEVAKSLDLPQHVLRFWETKFHKIRPLKMGGGRRYYRPEDIEVLKNIQKLLHQDGYTIRGVQNIFNTASKRLETSTPGEKNHGENKPRQSFDESKLESIIDDFQEVQDILNAQV